MKQPNSKTYVNVRADNVVGTVVRVHPDDPEMLLVSLNLGDTDITFMGRDIAAWTGSLILALARIREGTEPVDGKRECPHCGKFTYELLGLLEEQPLCWTCNRVRDMEREEEQEASRIAEYRAQIAAAKDAQ